MYSPVVVQVGRTNVVGVSVGRDLSNSVLTSEIRKSKSVDSALIATWEVTPATDYTDGNVVLTLDDSDTVGIQHKSGYMDIKEVVDGEPVSVFKEPLPVSFEGVVTA